MSKAQEMAALFEINLDSNLDESSSSDYDVRASDDAPTESFENVCQHVVSVMEEEPVPEEEKRSIPEENEIETEVETEVEREVETEAEETKKDSSSADDDLIKDAVEEAGGRVSPPDDPPPLPASTSQDTNDNPLGLIGDDLKAYRIISEKYPRFNLYNGDGLFKKFYVYKLRMLRTLLSRFPVLDLKARRKEIMETKIDHHVGKGTVHPDQFREKIDDCFRSRIRLGELLGDAYDQAASWKRHLELLQGKLYKDHELRGAHKREGLNAEHMQDVEDYVAELRGFIQRADHADDLLCAAHESLSRQLACIQMRQPSAGKTTPEPNVQAVEAIQEMKKQDPALGDLDAIDDGAVIGAPKPSDSVTSVVDMGKFDPDDDLMNVGVKK